MKKKVTEISNVLYGVGNYCCEPTMDEIKAAINNNNLEFRAFQTDIKALNDEWNNHANGKEESYYMLQKQYHARRIAYFVVNGWKCPILLYNDGCTIKDGLHRYKAAIYKGLDTVDVEVTVDHA